MLTLINSTYGTVGPARAGMIRRFERLPVNCVCWPRTSGDDPQTDTETISLARLAPHERG